MTNHTWTYKGTTDEQDAAHRQLLVDQYGEYGPNDVLGGHAGLPKPSYTQVPNVMLRGNTMAAWGMTLSYRMVLLYLYSWADRKTGKVSRGLNRMAEETDLSKTMVVRALDHMEGLGWVTCLGRDGAVNRKVYCLNMGVIVACLNLARDGFDAEL